MTDIEPGYCDRCGHKLAGHSEAGICLFTCDCESGICGCDRSELLEQFRLFPMADAEEIGMEAIVETRRLTEMDAARVRRRPWLTPRDTATATNRQSDA